MPQKEEAKYGIRTRDTNLEGWDVTTTPISQHRKKNFLAGGGHCNYYNECQYGAKTPTTQVGFEPTTDCLEGSCSNPLSY